MNQINYHWANPPSCLINFVVTPAQLPGVGFDGHCNSIDVTFRLYCPCEASDFFVVGHYWRNPDFRNQLVFLSPIALRCSACGRESELIDTDVHGYDGVIGASATKRGEGPRVDFACIKCGSQPFDIFARFAYPDDLFSRHYDDYRGRESDLFDWFSLRGICANCRQLRNIADFECA
jgi:hypothetical protein